MQIEMEDMQGDEIAQVSGGIGQPRYQEDRSLQDFLDRFARNPMPVPLPIDWGV